MTFGIEAGDASPVGAVAVVLIAVAFVVHRARSPARRELRVLRALAAGALALAVFRPGVALMESRRVKPKLLIILDAASSMQGKSLGGTRWSQALEWLQRSRSRIDERAQSSVVLVSDRARALSDFEQLRGATPDAASFSPINALADFTPPEGPPARVWLISDGIAEGSADLDRLLSGFGAPVDTLGVGPARRDRGAAFLEIKTPDFAFLHESFEVGTKIEASGLAGRKIVIALARADEGVSGGWRESAVREFRAASDLETFTSTFTVNAERLGAEHWRLQSRVDGSVRTREFHVEVVRQKYRIMYLAGRPSHEYAFLRDFLKSDPNHELVSFVILRNPENPSPAEDRDMSLIPFPSEDIFVRTLPQFDMFILENFSAVRFRVPPAYLEQLKRFVANGGALLVKGGENAFSAGGYRGSPLEEVLPVTLSSRIPDFVPGLFSPRPISWEHPMIKLFDTKDDSRKAWEALPPLDGWARFDKTREGAQVIAVHPNEKAEDGSQLPVIAARAYGRGKVMLISTDSTWRWKLGAAADRLAAGVYERFWTRVVQYLTGSLDLSKVKFAPLPDHVVAREPFIASLRVFEKDFSPAASAQTRVQILWTSPGGAVREASVRETEPGTYAVELTGLSRGTHRLRASARLRGLAWGADETSFVWEPAIDSPMDRAWLSRTAAAGGGEFFDLAQSKPSDLLDKLPPPTLEKEAVRRYRPFSSALWLALTILLFFTEWAWRRWSGHA